MIDPDRGQARQWAQDELSRPEYARARPSWFSRLVHWVLDRLDHLASNAGLGTGQLVVLVLVLVVAAVALTVVVRRTVRTRVATAGGPAGVLGDTTLTGEEHRRRAERATAEGRYDDAVREWLRALARRLDERGLLDPRPGRTADELAAETAALMPSLAAELTRGAATFDAVTYGSLPARAEDAEQLRRLDAAAEAERPARAARALQTTGRG